MVTHTRQQATVIPPDIFVPAYELIRGIEDKIKNRYPDAEFQLLCGPEEALHLKVYSDAPSMWDVMELVRDDLMELREAAEMCLYVVPVRHEDREDPPNAARLNGNHA